MMSRHSACILALKICVRGFYSDIIRDAAAPVDTPCCQIGYGIVGLIQGVTLCHQEFFLEAPAFRPGRKSKHLSDVFRGDGLGRVEG